MKASLLAFGLLAAVSTSPLDDETCAALAASGFEGMESPDEIQALCPTLSPDDILAHVFRYSP